MSDGHQDTANVNGTTLADPAVRYDTLKKGREVNKGRIQTVNIRG